MLFAFTRFGVCEHEVLEINYFFETIFFDYRATMFKIFSDACTIIDFISKTQTLIVVTARIVYSVYVKPPVSRLCGTLFRSDRFTRSVRYVTRAHGLPTIVQTSRSHVARVETIIYRPLIYFSPTFFHADNWNDKIGNLSCTIRLDWTQTIEKRISNVISRNEVWAHWLESYRLKGQMSARLYWFIFNSKISELESHTFYSQLKILTRKINAYF